MDLPQVSLEKLQKRSYNHDAVHLYNVECILSGALAGSAMGGSLIFALMVAGGPVTWAIGGSIVAISLLANGAAVLACSA